MKITVKLFASFRTGRFDIDGREYPDDSTVGDVVADLSLPEAELGIILVNSRHVNVEHRLMDGDTLAVFPLLGGG